MFLKIIKSKGYSYLKLVESYRENGKTRQRVLFNFGSLNRLIETGQLERMGLRLLELSGNKASVIQEMEETGRYGYGDVVYKRLWDRYLIDELLKDVLDNRKVKFDFREAVYLMVMDRLLFPRSKLGTYGSQGRYLYAKKVKLNALYRSLDILAESKEMIEEALFSRYQTLFNQEVDVVFYDVTTYHFESVRPDELREFGYSKAGKMNEVQVVMGLLLDQEGHPIGFELFPGNTHDSKTFLDALNSLQKRFSLRRVIVVADQGIVSHKNLYALLSGGYEYIVRMRLKGAPKVIEEQVFEEEGYKVGAKDEEGGVILRYKVIDGHRFVYRDEEGKRHSMEDTVVIYWSRKLAEKHALDRERAVNKALKVVEGERSLSDKKGYRRYVATDSQRIIGLNEQRIREDALWDGYLGLQTNVKNMTAREIIKAYGQLWQIENAFRILKSTMQARPIYHWTPKRIKGHFMVCFLAFVLERALEIRLYRNGVRVSPERIRQALNSLEVSEIHLEDHDFYLKGKHDSLATKIMRIMKIKPLKNVLSREELLSIYK